MPPFAAGNKASILLIEPLPEDQAILKAALRDAAIHIPIEAVESGQSAIQWLFGHKTAGASPPPCLIVLDPALPDMDGLSLLRRIKTEPATRFIPVIVLTRSSAHRHMAESYGYGASSYIVKSGNPEQFSEAVQGMARYWLEICRLPAG